MSIVQNTRVFLNFFFFLGQSPFSVGLICFSSSTVWALVPGYSISIIYFVASAECLYSLLSSGSREGVGFADTIIAQFTIICDIFRACCLLRQCYHDRNLIFKIMKTFEDLDTTFANDLNFQLSYQEFRNSFVNKIFLFAGVYLLSLVSPIIQFWKSKRFNSIVLRVKLLQIMIIVSILHIVFNVDLVRYFMQQLNATIERDINTAHKINAKQQNMAAKNRLKCYKTIHYRLWLSVQRLNRYFGWNVLSIVLRSFVHIIFALHWLIGHFERAAGILRITRRYISMLISHIFIC